MRATTVQRIRRWDWWLLAAWIVAISLVRASRLEDTDPYWQIVAGRESLTATSLARPDNWSWAPVNGLFYPTSPAWNAALARAWDLAGSWGLFCIAALTIAAYLTCVAYLARRLGAGPLATIASIIVTSLVALPMLSPRATLAAQLLLMAAICLAAYWAPRAAHHRAIINATLLTGVGFGFAFIGNWVHLSWSTLALAAALAWLVIWWASPGLARPSRIAMTAAGSIGLLVGLTFGPYGLSAYSRAQAVLDACRGLIIEWSSAFDIELVRRWAIPATIAILISVAAFAWCVTTVRSNRKRSERLAVVSSMTVIALPASLAGIVAIRFIGIAMLTIAPVTALLISVGMRRIHAHATTSRGDASRAAEYTSAKAWRILLTAVLIVLTPFIGWLARAHAQPDTYDATTLLPPGCQLFSRDSEAAAVILLRPDVKVWIDGRADYWGRERLEEYRRFTGAIDPDNPVPTGTTCVLLPPAQSNPELTGIITALDDSSTWVRLGTTDQATVWVRQAN